VYIFKPLVSVSMLLYPVRHRHIFIQEFIQKSVLLSFSAEKKSHYFHLIFHDLRISMLNLRNANYLTLFCNILLFSENTVSITGSCFSSIYFHGKYKVLGLRCHSCYSCLCLYWQSSFAFARFLLCVHFRLNIFIYKLKKCDNVVWRGFGGHAWCKEATWKTQAHMEG
jgi:hypothetical protein